MTATVENARTAHEDLGSMTERLIGEYEASSPAGSVIRLVARTVQDLRHDGVASVRLAELAEPRVRAQLNGRCRTP